MEQYTESATLTEHGWSAKIKGWYDPVAPGPGSAYWKVAIEYWQNGAWTTTMQQIGPFQLIGTVATPWRSISGIREAGTTPVGSGLYNLETAYTTTIAIDSDGDPIKVEFHIHEYLPPGPPDKIVWLTKIWMWNGPNSRQFHNADQEQLEGGVGKTP